MWKRICSCEHVYQIKTLCEAAVKHETRSWYCYKLTNLDQLLFHESMKTTWHPRFQRVVCLQITIDAN